MDDLPVFDLENADDDLLAEELRTLDSTKITIASDDGVCCQFEDTVSVLQAIASYRSVGIILDSASATVPDLSAIHASVHHGVLGRLGLSFPLRFRVEEADGCATPAEGRMLTPRRAAPDLNDVGWDIHAAVALGAAIDGHSAMHLIRRSEPKPWRLW